MLRLQQTFGAHAGRVREVDQDVVRFGRLPTNDYAFDPHADLDASGNHAEIRKENGRYVLVDVGSRNGTLVNGRPVQRHVLEGGEEIEFGTGGPRVRVEITAQASTGRGAPTAPATPIAPIDVPVSPQGPTAFAPPIGGAAVPTPQWPASSPPFGPPVAAVPPSAVPLPPSAVPPSAAPPPMVLSPAPIPPGGSPKLYGQKTVDLMIQSAVAASSPGAGTPAPIPPSAAHDTAYIRKIADDAAGKKSRPMVFVLAIVLALFLVVLCGVSGIIAVLWLRAYGSAL
ncbi:FHA domain-containing protein [Sandaracinus amylolyticus]|uniref:FHA domain-containing protein n=1 Tax=Sandaracinus amylolyticus TaxID=927083 RepID=UPI001F025B87|nr:FHA domain-containing protein [Sandaracinus amylolyticus]UJR78785.1 FHA domain-containing protein [Sandaracinus amylolyticus]